MWARGGSHLGHDDWVVSCGARPSTDIFRQLFQLGVVDATCQAQDGIVPGTQSSITSRSFGVATVEENANHAAVPRFL